MSNQGSMVDNNRVSALDALSTDAFIQLLKVLPPKKISELRIQGLPTSLPTSVYDTLPPATRTAVEQLLQNSNSFHPHQQKKDQRHSKDELTTILNQARISEDITKIRLFKEKVRNLLQMQSRPNADSTLLHNDQIEINIEHINRLLIDVHGEYSSNLEIIEKLEGIRVTGDKERGKLDKSIGRLRLQSKRTIRLLGEFYLIRYKRSEHALQLKIAQIKAQDKNKGVKGEFNTLRKRLNTSQAMWRRIFNAEDTQRDYQDLKVRITAVVDEINANRVMIAENDLIRWLDAIADADLNPYSKPRATKSAQQAWIALRQLLIEYCAQMEESALQIAQVPFLENDPLKTIDYLLTSEQLVLDYFVNRKKDTTAMIDDIAKKKLKDLKRNKRSIFAELRRNNKLYCQT
jgi:hypothetical protein